MISIEFAADANAAIAAIAQAATSAIERIVVLVAEQPDRDDADVPVDGEPVPQDIQRTREAERKRRYRDKRRDMSLGHERDKRDMSQGQTGHLSHVSRVAPSRAVVQELELQQQLPRERDTGNTGSVSSSDLNSARALLGNINETVQRVAGQARDMSQGQRRDTRDMSQGQNGTSDRDMDRGAEALELSIALGAVVSDKLRAMFRRHNVAATQQRAWVRLVAEILKDTSYRPGDVGAACDDDAINPITKGPFGFRSFVAAARDRRLRDGTAPSEDLADLKRLLPHIETRRGSPTTYGEPWWDWCIEGAAREGLVNAYVFAALHFDDPWPMP